ncbi:Structural maintenance of chromosomes protein 5 [Pseudocercospora fuligena]|uniref:Structural maintenance of chromosomes protein 5 n=1 Tax=Pseudocercospora fuligena TaxID=685502 RepID=A0A8H6VEB0_9PEZI|nr:Structural maintenance of chromosomes protein 5 [Pseudocercospora fuligena]
MKTFVTYTHAEFLPGPNLNMIIGPNGTGKSTLVCAICLGLGWKPEHLGRAKDVAEFVKHGAKEATIEIELKADTDIHPENPVITCIINRDGGKGDDKKTSFKINGRKSTRKAVQELCKKNYSIQVDNLCQFLPQDRVVEFAALSPVELLVQTQRAAADPYMSEWHDQLKTMRKDQREKQAENQDLVGTLKEMESRQRRQAEDVEKFREKEALRDRLNALEKMKPVAEYSDIRKGLGEARERRKAAEKEFRALERRMEPNFAAMNSKDAYRKQLDRVVNQRSNLVAQTETRLGGEQGKLRDSSDQIQQCTEELNNEIDRVKKDKATLLRLQPDLNRLRAEKDKPAPEFDFEVLSEKIKDLSDRIKDIDKEEDEPTDQIRSLGLQARQRQEMIKDEQAKRVHLQSQAGKMSSQIQRHSAQSAKLWDWLQDNREQFTGNVFGPAMVECSVKNKHQANMVEAIIGGGDLKAFTVVNREDFRKLIDHGSKTMKLWDLAVQSVSQPLSDFEHPLSDEQLKSLGLEGWVQDLLEGPDAVLAMLCSNRNLHKIPYGKTENFDDTQIESLKRAGIMSWVTPKKTWTVARRYGHDSIKVSSFNPAKLLTDAPVNTQAEQEIGRKIAEWEDEIRQIAEEMKGVKARASQLQRQKKDLIAERDDLKKEKEEKQKQVAMWQGLETKIANAEKKIEDAQAAVKSGYGKVQAIKDKELDLLLKKGQRALDYARLLDSLRKLHEQLFEAEIIRIEAESDYEQLKAQNEEERTQLAERQAEVARLVAVEGQLKRSGEALVERIQQLSSDLTPEEDEVRQEITGKTLEELNAMIEQQKARLEMVGHTGGQNLLKEYEDRERKIEQKRAQLNTLESDLEELDAKITEVRGRWEPELDELIASISEAFSENFARVQCAGEVAVHKDEDFEQWAIQIKVKFRYVTLTPLTITITTDTPRRENESLSILDSHRQSGGERAVSTIFYLMALQSLARAPFRVVDEINQGMDPRNERLVHSRMVDIACAEHTSQYFLITPKLLNGLKYHKNMKVHCIASGEYMPDSKEETRLGTFEEMAMKALAIRNAA